MKINRNPKTYNGIKDEDLKADVLRVINEYQDTSLKCYKAHGKYSATAIGSHYGNWSNLLRELNIEPVMHYGATKEEVLADIKRVFLETGNTSRANYEKYGKYSRCLFSNRFGKSWNKILEMLGCQVNMFKPGQYTKEDILQNYQNECKKHEKLLNAKEFRKYGKFSQSIIDKIFGGFSKMQQELGLPYFIKSYTDDEIKTILTEAYKKYGPLNTVIVDKQTRLNIPTLVNKYGSLKQACMFFGIPYDNDHNAKNSAMFKIVKQKAEDILGSSYTVEQTFDWLIYSRNLFIDLFYPNLNLAIEVDGDQHYIASKYFGGEKGLAIIQARDNRKNELLTEHGIHLIRINSKNIKNTEKILKDFLASTKIQKQV